MAHLASLKPPSPKPSISTFPSKITTLIPRPRLFQVRAVNNGNGQLVYEERQLPRRNVALIGLAGVVLGLSAVGGSAEAAARRPPPPPPEEKRDPNVTGLAAKVLASKKRKEALKESVAKLREKGKKITEEKPSEAQ